MLFLTLTLAAALERRAPRDLALSQAGALGTTEMKCVKRNVPGAGMKPAHGKNVYKDGYSFVSCMNDLMESQADKHGSQRHAFAGFPGNVSIVRYADMVDNDVQEAMTPTVCFEFCRTVKNMGFFGLHNGRDCYCTPYTKRGSGEGTCDRPCDGNKGLACGGKDMSMVYEMHTCGSTGDELHDEIELAHDAEVHAKESGEEAAELAHSLEASAEKLMQEAIDGGDMASHHFAQEAKALVSSVLHAGEAAVKVADELESEEQKGEALEAKDFTVPANIEAVEDELEKLHALSAEAEKDAHMADKMIRSVHPDLSDVNATEIARLFIPILSGIGRWKSTEDARFEEMDTGEMGLQSTCEGETAADPKVGLSLAECAAACDELAIPGAGTQCVAFNHYVVRGEEPICYLLKSVKEVWKYRCEYGSEWGECEDLRPDSSPSGKWHDSDGPYYDCNWYAAWDFCENGSHFTNYGLTPNDACCACGKPALVQKKAAHSFLEKDTKKHKKDAWRVQNKCMGSASWIIREPVKPEINTLDRCFGVD